MLSLNIANNDLSETIGRKLEEVTAANKTLIDFQFYDNKLDLRSIEIIQANIKRNKAQYDADRLQEWKERKLMFNEDNAMRIKQIEMESRKKKNQLDEESKEQRDQQLDEQWKKEEQEDLDLKAQLIAQLEEAAEIRNSKKKKKKKGGKKKKK